MQLIAFLNFTAAMQGFFLASLLVNKGQSQEHRLLALLVLCLSTVILGPALGLSGYYREFPHLIRISDPLALLLGPLLYFYLHQLTANRLPKWYFLHLLPFLLYLASLLPFYLSNGEEKIAHVDLLLRSPVPVTQAILLQTVRTVLVGAYVVVSLLRIRQYQRLLKANFSDIAELSLGKLDFLLRLYLFIGIMGIGIYALVFVTPMNFLLANNLTALALSAVIYALAYTTWNRPAAAGLHQLVEPPSILPATASTEDPSFPPPEASAEDKARSTYNIPAPQYAALAERLEQLLEQEKVFLESELSLAQLSEKLSIPPYQTSELISRRYQEPFFDLINRYRIKEVKSRLNHPDFSHFSILGIALDCGFNTKSSFNTAFKKFTGLTPSAYRKTAVAVPA